MTNEERDKAIRILQWLHDNDFLFRSTEEDVKYATKLGIQALEQKPCCDAISRQAAIGIIQNWLKAEGYSWGERNVMLCTIEELRGLPSVSTEKTGHWIRMKAYEKWGCSECYTVFRFTFKEHDYCPNCGAKMVEPHCGNCKFCGEVLKDNIHSCNNNKSIFKACLETATGCCMFEPQESEKTETWNGYHGQITAPNGTFERIFNDADDDSDI